MSIPVKVFTGKRNAHGISEHMVDFEIVDINVSRTTTFDELLQKCAVRCGIQPMYISLFAIWDVSSDTWKNLKNYIYPMNDDIRGKDGSIFEFRIRFLVKTEISSNGQKGEAQRWDAYKEGFSRIMDKVVMKYLYRQQRHDFQRDRISVTLGSEDDSFSVALGVAALDLLCLSRIADVKLTTLQKTVPVKHLLSTSFRRRFRDYGLINRFQIKMKFQHFVRCLTPAAERWQQSGHDLDFFLRRYLLNLELCTALYGVEKYNLAKSGFITVSGDNGVNLHIDETKAEKWCDLSEITHMTLQIRSSDVNGSNAMSNHPSVSSEGGGPLGIVSISKLDGACKNFVMESSSSAENLASCIDGYYRLLVDAHHYLCKDVCSSALVRHSSMKCHGPITCRYAEELLQERHDQNLATVGDCVIRMSKDSWDEYFVNTVHSVDPFKIRNYKMDRSPDNLLGLYGLEESHRHDTLESLLEECADGRYNNRRIPINPDKIIAPKSKHKSNLIIRLSHEALYTVYPKDEYQIKPKAVLIDFDPNEKQNVKHLGTGAFTIVKRYRNEDTGRCMVFKSILEQKEAQQNHHIHLSFQESTALLNRIDHQHFVQHIGMTMSHVTGIWLEYLPHKSITQYLQSGSLKLPNSSAWFLHVLWQITHACHYLEEEGYAHGNLQGKNVLLQIDTPQPHIKISDSGVRTRRRVSTDHGVDAKTSFVEPMLPAPWLAYEFCIPDRTTNIKYPTIEADKWSFGATVCEILNWGRISQGPCYGRELVEPLRGCYIHGDLRGCLGLPQLITANKELCDLITSCWCAIPDRRPSFQKILREIGSALTLDYVLLPIMPDDQIPDAIVKIDPDVPTYEDQKLTRICPLGEGHFGTVELFAYDRRNNSIREKVAIKEPRSSSMKQHKEFMQEIDTMKSINHPYIVRLLGITEPSGRIVMEYLKHGSLADVMKEYRNKNKIMPIPQMLRYCSQIAEGMIALQEKRLVHRDLALRNILLSNDPVSIKISDFGLSRFVKEGSEYYSGKLDEFPAHWYAPECLHVDSVRTFGFESDVWSYGITVWELFSYGERPYYKNLGPVIRPELLDKLRQLLRDGTRLPQTANCPNEVYSIMTRCWVYDKHKRLKFQEIKVEFDNLIPVANEGKLTYHQSSET